MKKVFRILSAVAITASVIVFATPASALTLLSSAGGALPTLPGAETLVLGLIGLGCLGLARQHATG
jgi:hypothetical protein